MSDVRLLALKGLIKIERDGGYSNLVVSSMIKENALDKREAGLLNRLICGTIERRITLDYAIGKFSSRDVSKITPDVMNILRLGAYQIFFSGKIPNSAAVNESVRLCRSIGKSTASGFVNAVLRKLSDCGKIPTPEKDADEKLSLSVKYSCPQWLVAKWMKQFGAEQTEKMLSYSLEKPEMYIRVNSLLITPEQLIEALKDDGISAEMSTLNNCLKITGMEGSVENSPAFRSGFFHVQDFSSQLCASVLGVRPGDVFADVCAAPGGKSYTAAQLMRNEGRVISCDLHEHRVKLIMDGAQRLKIDIIEPIVRDAMACSADIQADVVLCDVPCSGLGVIAQKPEIKYKNPDEFKSLHDIQYGILCKSSGMVKPGGRLVYSTCTLNKMENENIVNEFLKNNSEFELDAFSLPDTLDGNPMHGGMLNILPHYYGCGGFFIGVMQRK